MFKVYLNVLKHASFVYSVCGPSAFYSGPSFPTLFFLVLTQCDGCLDDTVWGLMAGLWGLPPMGADHCQGPTGHSGGPLLSQVPIFYTL